MQSIINYITDVKNIFEHNHITVHNGNNTLKYIDIKYPIIIDSNYNILDGVHRYVKHIIENKKTIDVYIFDKKIMKKFIIGKRDEKINLKLNDFIELFYSRFK